MIKGTQEAHLRGNVSMLRIEPTFHHRKGSMTNWPYKDGEWCRAGGQGQVLASNAKTQDSKRFNSQVRRNTLPIWVCYLSMFKRLETAYAFVCEERLPFNDHVVKKRHWTLRIFDHLICVNLTQENPVQYSVHQLSVAKNRTTLSPIQPNLGHCMFQKVVFLQKSRTL